MICLALGHDRALPVRAVMRAVIHGALLGGVALDGQLMRCHDVIRRTHLPLLKSWQSRKNPLGNRLLSLRGLASVESHSDL